jgi:histone H3/H4
MVEERSVMEAAAHEAGEPMATVTLADLDLEVPAFDDEAEEENAVDAQDEEVGIDDTTTVPLDEVTARKPLQLRKKQKRISQHGIEYPALPPTFVKKVAQTALQSSGLSNTRISADTLVALTQASDWFFEQLGDDLGAYASHAKRKTIEESDVMTLMRR